MPHGDLSDFTAISLFATVTGLPLAVCTADFLAGFELFVSRRACVCVCGCVRACACMPVRACVCAYMPVSRCPRVCVSVCVCVCVSLGRLPVRTAVDALGEHRARAGSERGRRSAVPGRNRPAGLGASPGLTAQAAIVSPPAAATGCLSRPQEVATDSERVTAARLPGAAARGDVGALGLGCSDARRAAEAAAAPIPSHSRGRVAA
jgi:hypothetical protein